MTERYQTFEQFWPFYVSQHLNRTNRLLHFVGTTGALICFVLSMIVAWPFAVLVLPVGYGCAWFGHRKFEKNKPATFQYPLWSFVGDIKMYVLICLGLMEYEVFLTNATREAFSSCRGHWTGYYPAARTIMKAVKMATEHAPKEKVDEFYREIAQQLKQSRLEQQRNRERTSDVYKRS